MRPAESQILNGFEVAHEARQIVELPPEPVHFLTRFIYRDDPVYPHAEFVRHTDVRALTRTARSYADGLV